MIIPPLSLGEPIRNRTEGVRAGAPIHCGSIASRTGTPEAALKASKLAENLIKLTTRRNRIPSGFRAGTTTTPGNVPTSRQQETV